MAWRSPRSQRCRRWSIGSSCTLTLQAPPPPNTTPIPRRGRWRCRKVRVRGREGGREGGGEGRREGRREGGREGGRDRGREGEKEAWGVGGGAPFINIIHFCSNNYILLYIMLCCTVQKNSPVAYILLGGVGTGGSAGSWLKVRRYTIA